MVADRRIRFRQRASGWFGFALLCLGLAGLAVGLSPARGSVVEPLTVPELTQRAQRVVVADVRSTASAWVSGHLETRIELALVAAWKGPGQAGDTLVVRQLGGQVGDLSQRVVGAPVLHAGERVVLFLMLSADGNHRLLGLGQGLFRVDLGSGKESVAPPADGTSTGPGPWVGVPLMTAGPLDQADLSALEALVRAAAHPPSR